MSGLTVGEVLARASVVEVNGGELEPIGTIYRPEGVWEWVPADD